MSDNIADRNKISRRDLLRHSAAIAPLAMTGACLLRSNAVAVAQNVERGVSGSSIRDVVRKEAHWNELRKAFKLNKDAINLRTIAQTLSPAAVRTSISSGFREYDLKEPSARVSQARKESLRAKVARHMGCAADEVALTRNVTDGVTVVLGGAPLRSGDEILTSNHEHMPYYGKMWQRSVSSGIRVRHVKLPIAADSIEDMLDPFTSAVTPKTRLIFVCHVYLTGQLFPVRELCDWARSRNIQVCVDGALAVGHIDFRLDELGCDYYAGNFHKCLNGPDGTGFLYVKKARIPQLMPLYGTFDYKAFRLNFDGEDVRKFEEFGTRSLPLLWAVEQALDFRESIGGALIEARMRYLKNLFIAEIDGHGYQLTMSRNETTSSGLICFDRPGSTWRDLASYLYKHKIYISGGYVANDFSDPVAPKYRREPILTNPAVFTSRTEIERFAAVLKSFARRPT